MGQGTQSIVLGARHHVFYQVHAWVKASADHYALTLAVVLLVATMLRYGIGIYPNLDRMVDLAVNWRDPVSPTWREDFWVSSPVSAWSAGVLGLTEPRWFLLFHAGLAVVALLLPFALPSVRRHPRRAQLVFVVMAAGPIGAVLFSWLGSYDAICAIAIVLAALSRSTLLRCLGWFILAFNHAALGLAALLLCIPLMLLASPGTQAWSRLRVPALATVSVLVGFAANTQLMRTWGAETSRLDFFTRVGFETYVHLALMAAPVIAFSALGVGWLVLTDSRVRCRRDGRVMLGVAITATVVIPLITLDQSRVLGLALLAPMLLWALAASDHYQPQMLKGLWRTWRIPAVLVPVVLVWYQGFVVPGWTWFLGLPPVLATLRALPG